MADQTVIVEIPVELPNIDQATAAVAGLQSGLERLETTAGSVNAALAGIGGGEGLSALTAAVDQALAALTALQTGAQNAISSLSDLGPAGKSLSDIDSAAQSAAQAVAGVGDAAGGMAGIETGATAAASGLEAVAQAAGGAQTELAAEADAAAESGRSHEAAAGAASGHAASLSNLSGVGGVLTGVLAEQGVPVKELTEHFSKLKEGMGALTGEEASLGEATGLLGAGFVGLAALAIGKAVEGFVELGDAMHELSETTGVSVETAQGLGYAMQTMGDSADSASRPLMLLERNAGTLSDQLDKGQQPTGKFADSLDKLGISAQAFVAMSPDQRIRAIMDAFAGLGEGVNKTQLAMDLFGRQGASMIGILDQGSAAIDRGIEKTNGFGASVADSWPKVQQWHTAQADLNTSLQGLEVTLGSGVLPVLSQFIEGVSVATGKVHDLMTAIPGPVRDAASAILQAGLPATEAWNAVTSLASGTTDKHTQSLKDHTAAVNEDTKAVDANATGWFDWSQNAGLASGQINPFNLSIKDNTAAVTENSTANQVAADNAKQLADAWTAVTQNGGSVPGMLAELDREFGSTDEKVTTLQQHVLELFNKPTQEELDLKAQIADVNATILTLQSNLANSSPALQHVAALQKIYDQSVLTGGTIKQQADAKAALDLALSQTGAAGADAAATQTRIDKLSLAKGGLDAHLLAVEADRGRLAAHTQALGENAGSLDQDRTEFDKLTGAVVSGSASMTQAVAGVVTALGGIGGAIRAAQSAAAGMGGGGALGAGVGSFPAASGGALTPQQIAQGLLAAGLPPDAIATMTAILLAETGGTGSTTALSAAGARGFAQLMPGFEGISEANRMGTDPASLQAQFQAVARGYAGRGFKPWNPWDYVGGGDPNVDYGAVYVGPGQGSLRGYLPQAQTAAAAAIAAGGQFPTGGGGLSGALGGVGAALSGVGALPVAAPNPAAAAPAAAKPLTPVDVENETTSAQKGLDDLDKLAQTVNSTTKASLADVTQATVDSQQSVVASAKATALARIQDAKDAENTLLADLAAGAGPERIKQDKANVASADQAAKDATDAWKNADGTLTTDQKAVVDNFNVSQSTMLESARASYAEQTALYGDAVKEQHIQDLGRVPAHREVNAQTVADDRTSLETYQGLAATAYQNVTELQRQSTAAHQKLLDDQANHADALTIAQDTATANSLDAQLQQWQAYFDALGQKADASAQQLIADGDKVAAANKQHVIDQLNQVLHQEDVGAQIADAQSRYARAANDPTATPQARAQAASNEAAIGPLKLQLDQSQRNETLLTQFLTDNFPQMNAQQVAAVQSSIAAAHQNSIDIQGRISHLDDTTAALAIPLEGAAATAHNQALQAGLDVYGRPTGGAAGGGGTSGGAMSAQNLEDFNFRNTSNNINAYSSLFLIYQLEKQQADEQAAFQQQMLGYQQQMLDNLKAGRKALEGLPYNLFGGPDPTKDYGAVGIDPWHNTLPIAAGMRIGAVGGGAGSLGHDALAGLIPPTVGRSTTIIVNLGNNELVKVLLPDITRYQGQTLELSSAGVLGPH